MLQMDKELNTADVVVVVVVVVVGFEVNYNQKLFSEIL
jgi:hypothetical protein